MLRTILVCLVSLSSLFAGVKIKSYYKKREEVWDELYKFALFFKEEAIFNKTLLEDIFEKFHLSEELRQVKDGNFENLSIDGEDSKWINEFFGSLGRLNMVLEIENIDRYIAKIRDRYEKERNISHDRGGVSIKLGALIGVGVFVLLI